LSTDCTDIRGYVLAGGASRRLGRDKRRLAFGGVTLLDRTRRLLRQLTGTEPIVVGDNLGEILVDTRYVIQDAKSDCGPLGGLVAALHHCPTAWCMLLAVDMPRLGIDDLRRLAEARSDDYDVITLSKSGHPEPLAALYHTRCADSWNRFLDSGMFSVIDIIRTLRWKPVILGVNTRSLEGINTPEDLSRVVDR
jgi:molybdopterin-guanine dinucleotide biosynthesis protein A